MKKILISRRKGETQAAVLKDGEFESYFVERDNEPPKFVGSIFFAQVEKILTGMQAAFVDIGREQNAFMQFQNKNLREGEKILVQIEKDAEHYKAARATFEISLPSRKIILLPTANKIHVSKKISDTEKLRLKNLVKKFLPENIGVIIRTAAENCTAEELKTEIDEFLKLWQEILTVSQNKKKPSLIYGEDLIKKIVREDFFDCEIFITDNLKIFRRVEELAGESEKIQFYEGEELLKNFGVDTEIKNLQLKELPLPSGGFIVIEKTEALTVVDVNTGSAKNIYQTNLEAAALLMKQIRLRNIGGIVIADFINMKTDTDKKNLLEYLKTLAQIDRGKTFIVDMTPLGLVEITRQPY
ncbi:MAG: ribonuclease E/G [Selenomonadaceae bacterium]|nr:ribonuclease E/G [Selenomonadaceae bacterium]